MKPEDRFFLYGLFTHTSLIMINKRGGHEDILYADNMSNKVMNE